MGKRLNRRRTFTLAAAIALTGTAWAATPLTNALWVYSVSSLPNAVTNSAAQDALIQNSAASGVNMIYVSVYSSTPNSAGRNLDDEDSISGLISQAHSAGIKVFAA